MERSRSTDVEFWQACQQLQGCVFRHRGRSAHRADCIGLVFVACDLMGHPIAPFTNYRRRPDPAVLLREVAKRCEPQPWGDFTKVGRLLVIQPAGPEKGGPLHFAVMGPDGLAAEIKDRWGMTKVIPETVHSVWLVSGIRATV